MLKKVLSACVFAVLACATGTADAQTMDRRTFFTFSQPVTLPGVTLPAGKYLFRVPDAGTSRRVVQVLSADERQNYAMLLSIPAQRLDAPEQPEIRFMETAADMPAAIKTWWYPGSTIGFEFIYPKEQALRLAKGAEAPVLTTASAASDSTEEMKTADLARVSSSGEETAVTAAESPAATAVSGASQQGEVAPATAMASTAPQPEPVTQVARRELPATSSTLPLIAVAGWALFCSGIWMAARPRF